MKKIVLMIMFILLSIGIVGCQEITYDDVFLTYNNYIDNQASDYEDLMAIYNTINTEIIYATITVNNTIEELSISTTGSGVIYDEDESYYYALTNSHVIGADASYHHSISVLDATGKYYDATLIAYDTNFDLAVIRFRKNGDALLVIDMAVSNPDHKMPVIVLGHPDGQINAITIGYYLDMTEISLDTGSIGTIDFPVLKMDVPVQPGSSGSVLIDEDFIMIGLIFAGNFSEDAGVTSYSYAVPIEKVYEFLGLYDLMGGESS